MNRAFLLRRATITLAVAGLLALTAACGNDDSDSASPGGSSQDAEQMEHGQPSGPACAPSGPDLAIAAKDLKFDKECLAAPPDQPFRIAFDNQDNGMPHNVAIFRDPGMSERLFTGEVFNGDDKRTYDVGPLPPGKYHFHCDVHPAQMEGELIVG